MKTFSSHRQYICIFITTLQNILKLSEFNPIQSCSMQDQYIVENQFYFSILTVNNWNSKCKRKKCNLQSVQFSSVAQSCLTLYDPIDCSNSRLPSLSITNTQTLLKLVSIESVMSSNHHLLSSPSPPPFNLCQHQGISQWDSSSHQVAKLLEFQLQHQSYQWIFRTNFL